MKKPRNVVGPVIRALRVKCALTQPMLVAKLNLLGWDISRETLAKIEAQFRWVADFELLQLADALQRDAGDILNEAKREFQRQKRR